MTDTNQSDSPTLDEAFYRQVFEHLGVSLIATDESLRVKSWNRAAARMFGARAEQMIGRPAISVVPEERREATEQIFKRAVEHGEISEVEFQYRDSEGGPRELVATIAPIVGRDGGRVGATAAIRDITRRIKLQAELHESRKMASLGEMAGAMSHHFNNILGGIITSVDYARQSHDPIVQSRILDLISDSLTRATVLLRGLLNFAEGDPRADDLCDYILLVREFAEDIRRRAGERRIRFELKVQDEPALQVPRSKVTTVLRNVVQNAFDAMPDGGTLKITINADEHWVETTVQDTGHGVEEASLSRIFEPFWSTKSRLGESETARGLGLAVVHGILHVLGGSITASSEPGKGSTFVISLPRRK